MGNVMVGFCLSLWVLVMCDLISSWALFESWDSRSWVSLTVQGTWNWSWKRSSSWAEIFVFGKVFVAICYLGFRVRFGCTSRVQPKITCLLFINGLSLFTKFCTAAFFADDSKLLSETSSSVIVTLIIHVLTISLNGPSGMFFNF